MEPSKVTSKTSSLKALLLRAWRERWSDLQWGIHIKTILPRGVSGDVYNLADCILQQALVGPGPNHLVLSYLKHSLSSQLVSYAAVLQRISKYDGFHKPHCIISLLEFLENILPGITCRFKPEEEMIAGSVLSLAHWLLQCYYHTLQANNAENAPEMLIKPANILDHMLKRDFTVAMLYLAKHEHKDLYIEVANQCQILEAATNQSAHLASTAPIKNVLLKLCSLELAGTGLEVDKGVEPLTYCLQSVLAIQVLLNPSCDSQVLVNQLLMIQRIKGYSNVRLYSELIRACFMILYDVLDTSKESQWGAFTFLKVPHIILQLHNANLPRGVKTEDFSQDVVESLDFVLQFTPLLDTMDARCSCNNLECFLGELLKLNLVSDLHVNHYTAKREAAIAELHKMEAASSGMPITKVIIRAEPTLSRVLQSLDAEFPKESLLGMLCQVFTGKSFELILAVATVEGKLCTLVSKLINLNECCKQGIDESNKTLAMLFDITFLMLCYITQTFGSEVVLSDDGKGDSFMKQWVRECLVERGKPKSPDNMLQHCDSNIVEALLTQFTSTDTDFKINGMTWHEVCFNMPGAIREVLVAWEQEALSVTDVKRILDAMQAPMCCLPVCAVTWLCSYMQVSPQDALLKPMNMVQQFLKVPTSEELVKQELVKQNNYSERAALMVQIIRKMQFDVHTPTLSKVKAMGLAHNIISKQPVSEQLESVWTSLLKQGWIGIEATHSLESLLNTGGAHWFVTNLVKELVKLRYRDDLDRAVDLLMGVFHLDIESCTMCLLQQVLPQYLHNRLQSEDLVEPQSSALAKLCAYCIFATSISCGSSNSNSKKRSRCTMEAEDLEELCPASKILRLDSSSSPDATLVFLSSGNNESSSPPLQEPLASALKEVFKALSVIAERTAHVSQQTHFVFRFLEYIVRCGKDRARPVLQGMPNTLVPCLVRALPDLFTTDLILRLYDISTKNGRLATARDLCLLRNMTMKNST